MTTQHAGNGPPIGCTVHIREEVVELIARVLALPGDTHEQLIAKDEALTALFQAQMYLEDYKTCRKLQSATGEQVATLKG
jgi:hypothetical protein